MLKEGGRKRDAAHFGRDKRGMLLVIHDDDHDDDSVSAVSRVEKWTKVKGKKEVEMKKNH